MAENPYVNKVVYGDQTLIDLTADTVTPETLVLGAIAHDASGKQISGNVDPIGLHISGATVDDLVRVKTVDNNGKPTSWYPVSLADLLTKDNLASDVQESLDKADSSYDILTVSGDIVTFDAPADGITLKALTVNVEPVQDLHGYGSPWPAGGGKNKLSLASVVLGGSESRTKRLTINAIPAGTYKFIANNTGTETVLERYGLQFFDAITGGSKVGEATNGATFTLSGEAQSIYIWMDSSSYSEGKTVVLSDMMIFLSTEVDSTYAPYSNLCPISGWTSVNVSRTGVNMWDEQWELGGLASGTGAPYATTGRIRSKNYCNCKSNTVYYLFNNAPGVYLYIWWFDASKAYISTTGGNSAGAGITVTSPATAKYFKLTTYAGNYTEYANNFSVNYPATDTIYHPYEGNTYPITFPTEAGTVYGGTLDVTNGTLTVEYASYTIDENQDFVDRISAQGRVYFPLSNMQSDYSGLDDERCVCDRLKKKATINNTSQLLGITVGANNAYVYIGGPTNIPGVTDLVSFRTWLASNNITFTYKLATPITYQLTPTQIETLLGTNNIWADAGPVTVEHGNYIGMTLDLVSEKADKVQNATADNFAALDANGNLKDSSYKASDFLTAHQSLAAYRTAAAQDVIDTNLTTLGLTGASVGDLMRVAAIDANGKPTSWRKAPLCEIKTNPNLLDNWLFTNPANQRGKTAWQNAGEYTVDRWKLTSGSASIGANGLTLNGTIVQIRETAIGQAVECSALLTDGSIIEPTYDDTTRTLEISTESQKTIIAVKLELGSEQTLAHQENGQWVLNEIPDYQQELAKCQRYLATFPLYSIFTKSPDSTKDIIVCLPVPMASVPTTTGNISGITAWSTVVYSPYSNQIRIRASTDVGIPIAGGSIEFSSEL